MSDVEKVARAILPEIVERDDVGFDDLSERGKAHALRIATAAIAAIDEARGWRPIAGMEPEHGEQYHVWGPMLGQQAIVEWLDPKAMPEPHIREAGFYVSDGKNDPIWFRAWHYITVYRALPASPKEKA